MKPSDARIITCPPPRQSDPDHASGVPGPACAFATSPFGHCLRQPDTSSQPHSEVGKELLIRHMCVTLGQLIIKSVLATMFPVSREGTHACWNHRSKGRETNGSIILVQCEKCCYNRKLRGGPCARIYRTEHDRGRNLRDEKQELSEKRRPHQNRTEAVVS